MPISYEHIFKLRVHRKDSRTFSVHIFKTESAMRRAFKNNEKVSNIGRFYAVFQGHIDGESLGALYMYLPKTGPEKIGHEALHMALWYESEMRNNTHLYFKNHKVEERLAGTLEVIIRKLHNGIRRLK